MRKLEDVVKWDASSIESMLDKETISSLHKSRSSLEVRLWLRDRGIKDLTPLREDQYRSMKDLCHWTAKDIAKVREVTR